MRANLDLSAFPGRGMTDDRGFFELKNQDSVKNLIAWVSSNFCGKSIQMDLSAGIELDKSQINDLQGSDREIGTFIENYGNSYDGMRRTLTGNGTKISASITKIRIFYPAAHDSRIMCMSQGLFEISCK